MTAGDVVQAVREQNTQVATGMIVRRQFRAGRIFKPHLA